MIINLYKLLNLDKFLVFAPRTLETLTTLSWHIIYTICVFGEILLENMYVVRIFNPSKEFVALVKKISMINIASKLYLDGSLRIYQIFLNYIIPT